MGVLHAALVGVFVWYLLSRTGLARRDCLQLTVLVLFFFTMAAVLSFMLFNALAHGQAYGIGSRDTGKPYPVSSEPVFYWFLVALYWGGAVAAVSVGLAAAAGLLHAGLASEDAARSKGGESDGPVLPIERLAQYAAIAYLVAVLIAGYVFWSFGWELPSRNRVAALLFAPVFLFLGLLALWKGEVELETRSESRFAYWARVVLMLLLGLGLLMIGIDFVGT